MSPVCWILREERPAVTRCARANTEPVCLWQFALPKSMYGVRLGAGGGKAYGDVHISGHDCGTRVAHAVHTNTMRFHKSHLPPLMRM